MTLPETGGSPDIIDLRFVVRGEQVPADHADYLWQALRELLPWFDEEEQAGIHPLSGLSPGGDLRYLSQRARLTLRLPRHREAAASSLVGAMLSLGGHRLEIGHPSCRELGFSPVLHAKCVTYAVPGNETSSGDEQDFFRACEQELASLGMQPKLICGKLRKVRMPTGLLQGFSLLVAGLDHDATLRLQQHGLGHERKRGCGIFVLHKSMAAVGQLE
jgi:CRISPR-associated protein Cas6